MAATYNNLYLDARKRLREAGVEGAQLEARELVCCAAGKSREQFYRDMALYASDPVEEKLAELLERRLAGEPVLFFHHPDRLLQKTGDCMPIPNSPIPSCH